MAEKGPLTHPVIGRGDEGPAVDFIQRKLFAPLTGVYDEETESRVRGFQLSRGCRVTGHVDQDTADELELDPWIT